MSAKPDALGYAVCLDARGFAAEAAELRRLHAVNAELLGTLKWLDNWLGGKPMPECMNRIRAAIARAEEVKP